MTIGSDSFVEKPASREITTFNLWKKMKIGSRDILKPCVTLSELRRLTQREIAES